MSSNTGKTLIKQVRSQEIVHATCFSSETHGSTNMQITLFIILFRKDSRCALLAWRVLISYNHEISCWINSDLSAILYQYLVFFKRTYTTMLNYVMLHYIFNLAGSIWCLIFSVCFRSNKQPGIILLLKAYQRVMCWCPQISLWNRKI